MEPKRIISVTGLGYVGLPLALEFAKKFKEGVGSSIELIQAENDLLNAQSSFVEAARQLLDSRVSLDKNLNKF